MLLARGVIADRLVVLVTLVVAFVSPIELNSNDPGNVSSSAFQPENFTAEAINVDNFTATTSEEESLSENVALEETVSSSPAPEDGDTTSKNRSEFKASTSTSSSTDNDHDVSQESSAVCPIIGRKPLERKSIVKCHCDGMEVYSEGKCSPYADVIVPAQHHKYYTKLETISNYTVTKENVSCDPHNYHTQTFTEGEFHLRPRGDVVLLKGAGKREGQRINKYCVIHHLVDQVTLTWTLRACIPIPYVPRCCSFGKAMKNGICQPANTSRSLTPPIVMIPHSKDDVKLSKVLNCFNDLDCKSSLMKTFPLGNKGSQLLLLAQGLSLFWKPSEGNIFVVTNTPSYCIDVIGQSDGSVDNIINICHMTKKEEHDKACAGRSCIRKCCTDGSYYDTTQKKCLKDHNSASNTLNVSNLSNSKIIQVYGLPVCVHFTELEKGISIDNSGQLVHEKRKYSSADYCISSKEIHENITALVCEAEPFSWFMTKYHIVISCMVISLFFLTLCIACYLIVPELQTHGGIIQLCHILSLTIAYTSSFYLNVFHNDIGLNFAACFSVAIVSQYGYLAAFFWLNIMCFEIWRKIRKLIKYQTSTTYPGFFFMLYGWGMPLCLCAITIMMQFVNPHNVGGEIRPYIGINHCWFEEDAGLLLYFYGPIALLFLCNAVFVILTFMNNRILLRNSEEVLKELRRIGRSTRVMEDHVQDFHHKLKLIAMSVFCWVTEVLSWKIPPKDLWTLTDILNALQGLFIFIILLSNSNKRKRLEKRFPRVFRLARRCLDIACTLKGDPQTNTNNAPAPTHNQSTPNSVSFKTSTSSVTLSTLSSE